MAHIARVTSGKVSSSFSSARLRLLAAMAILLLGSRHALADGPSELAGLHALYPSLDSLYIDLHKNPELSLHEEKTASKLAARLRSLGFEVTDHVGGYGVVGVMKNGTGPTVLVRTDMDALPLRSRPDSPTPARQQSGTMPGERAGDACLRARHPHGVVGGCGDVACTDEKPVARNSRVCGPACRGGASGGRPHDKGRVTDALPETGLRARPARHPGSPCRPDRRGLRTGICRHPMPLTSSSLARGARAAPHLTIDPLLIAARDRRDAPDDCLARGQPV